MEGSNLYLSHTSSDRMLQGLFSKAVSDFAVLDACAQFDQPEVTYLMPPAPAEVHEIYSSSYTQVKVRIL